MISCWSTLMCAVSLSSGLKKISWHFSYKSCFLNHHIKILHMNNTTHTQKKISTVLLCCATMTIPLCLISLSGSVSYASSLGKISDFIFFFTRYIRLQCLFFVLASGPSSSERKLRGIGNSPSLHIAERLDNLSIMNDFTTLPLCPVLYCTMK